MSFEVGDVVKIKDNAWALVHRFLAFADPMYEFLGRIFTIREITEDGYYKLEDVKSDDIYLNDDGYWEWAEEWLEENAETEDVEENVEAEDVEESEVTELPE